MIKPMLAHKLDESKIDWDKPVYMQPKLDGVRCLFTKDGAFSRTGKQFMNVRHIEDSLSEYSILASVSSYVVSNCLKKSLSRSLSVY